MKTQFLYFREKGSQSYTYSSGGQTFTINDDANWDTDITADTQVKVVVTDVSAGTTHVIPANGKSFAANVITIAAASANGFDLAAGDTVDITLIPAQGTEAAFRADRLLSVHGNDDEATEVTFKASNGAATVDTVIFSHADDDGVAFRKIANYFSEAAAGNFVNSGAVITVADRANEIVASPLLDAGITKMRITVA